MSETPERLRLGLSTHLAAADALWIEPKGSVGLLEQVAPISQVPANSDQPRKIFDTEALAQLAESIQGKRR